MKDTAFFVSEDKWSRLATAYESKPNGEPGFLKYTGPYQESFKKKPSLLMGGAGLTSTLDDYARFYQMLLNNGQLDGVRILSKKSVEMMHTDTLQGMPHIGDMLPAYTGFGLTFAINPSPGKSGEPVSEGSYWWDGAAGTGFWIDPKENMFGIFLINMTPFTSDRTFQFRRMAYQAIQ
jgi:CubicO group peptidase (beta-lactamase class C family)